MKSMFLSFCFALSICATTVIRAADPPDNIATMVSQTDEGKIAFLSRVGNQLRTYTDHTRLEACASIATDGSRYGVVITTSGSHIGCVIHLDVVPEGMRDTGETIHSHGRKTKFDANKQDMQFLPANVTLIRMVRMDTESFSPDDYGRPGYLAGRRGLYYQHGAGTQVMVSSR